MKEERDMDNEPFDKVLVDVNVDPRDQTIMDLKAERAKLIVNLVNVKRENIDSFLKFQDIQRNEKTIMLRSNLLEEQNKFLQNEVGSLRTIIANLQDENNTLLSLLGEQQAGIANQSNLECDADGQKMDGHESNTDSESTKVELSVKPQTEKNSKTNNTAANNRKRQAKTKLVTKIESTEQPILKKARKNDVDEHKTDGHGSKTDPELTKVEQSVKPHMEESSRMIKTSTRRQTNTKSDTRTEPAAQPKLKQVRNMKQPKLKPEPKKKADSKKNKQFRA